MFDRQPDQCSPFENPKLTVLFKLRQSYRILDLPKNPNNESIYLSINLYIYIQKTKSFGSGRGDYGEERLR
uniref:Uncharacterized protein n=1 Tax=Cannabis sativa TaxID=3483 RepID=A0A803QWY2_CANSA